MLRLTRADVDAFAQQSGDHNPLHVAPEYARATAFGRPIAHGVLGLLMAARALPIDPGAGLRKLAVEFPRPLLLDGDYVLDVAADGPEAWALEVRDGSKPAIRGRLEFGREGGGRIGPGAATMRAAAAKPEGFARGDAKSGVYWPAGYDARGPWLDGGLAADDALALMLCSYIVGMELPGELALFTRLALEFEPIPAAGGALAWTVEVASWQPRTGALRLDLALTVGGAAWAKGSLRAFVRADAAAQPEPTLRRSDELEPRAFAGQTALIIGASRGLGRSLALTFAAHGGRVLAASRAPAKPDDDAMIIPVEADARDPEQLAAALAGLERLDLLVCNASPPLQPLTLEPATAARVHEHIHDAVALVSTPLALCLPRLAQARGVALLSSSEAVEAPPVEWAHYVAGKRAAEGLFEVAALQYPRVGFLVARMPRLDTAFSLNVSGEPAASAAEVALRLLERVASCDQRGRVGWITGLE